MAIDRRQVWLRVLAEAKRHKVGLGLSLIGTTILNLLMTFYRDQIMESVLPSLGKVSRWILSYPFALLGVLIVGIGLWLAYIALEEAFGQVESALLTAHGQRQYRPRIGAKFTAGFVMSCAIFPSIAVYGIWRHYRDPLPNVVALSRDFFVRNYRQNDLYVALILKNFSDVPVPVHITQHMYVEGVEFPATEGDDLRALTIPPWEEVTSHFEIGFKSDPNPGFYPGALWSLQHNKMTVGMDVAYNNGKRDVTFHFLGRLIGDHYVPGVDGQIVILENEFR